MVLASDSYITELQPDGTHKLTESRQTKLVAVEHFRGALAYWGLATYVRYSWSTLRWLRGWAGKAREFSSAETFAHSLASALNAGISNMQFKSETDSGIGIHFTAYEYIDGYWVPELFLISNWSDPTYQSIRADGVGVSRETCHTLTQQSPAPEHGSPQYRMRVHKYLQDGGWFIYNNGDPAMFNPAAAAVFRLLEMLSQRGLLARQEEVTTYLAIARRPIEIVADAQRDFCEKRSRVVGGKLHDLGITPNGLYESTTGDA